MNIYGIQYAEWSRPSSGKDFTEDDMPVRGYCDAIVITDDSTDGLATYCGLCRFGDCGKVLAVHGGLGNVTMVLASRIERFIELPIINRSSWAEDLRRRWKNG